MEYKNIIHVKITDEQLKNIMAIEKRMCINRSSVIRIAIQDFIDKHRDIIKNDKK